MQRTTVVKAINITSSAISLLIAWQAVRFCFGDIGAPGFDLLYKALFVASDSLGSFNSLMVDWIKKVSYYLGGIMTWLWFSILASMVGSALARIAEVGFDQYLSAVLKK